MACYYIVISSTHLHDGQLRSIKGVFRGPIGANGQRNTEEGDSGFYCELCDKKYVRHQQYENHINSYDHHHKQRLKELKQREFYRALACRRQRRRREEKREERAQRRFLQHEGKRTGECASGSGPMFRSTTVAIDPAIQSQPDLDRNRADFHARGATQGTKPQNQSIQPFLPLDPTLETRLLNNTQWPFHRTDANISTGGADESCFLKKTHVDRSHLTTNHTINPENKTCTNTSHIHKSPWSLNYINPISSNDIPTTDHNTKSNGSYFNRKIAINGCKNPTTTNTGRAMSTTSDILSGPTRVRPVSFSLPKRSCVLLHQSAAVFIQTGRGKQDSVTAQERVKNPDQQLKSPLSADVDNVCVDHCNTVNQCCVNSKTGTQHSESVEKRPSGPPESGAQVSLCYSKLTVPEIIVGSGAQLSLCNDDGTAAQVSSDCQNGTDLNLNSEIPEQISESVSTDSIQKVTEVEIHKQELSLPQEEKDLFCPGTNEPKSSVSGVLNETKESSAFPQPKEAACFVSNCSKTSTFALPNRPKEPFCRVMSRDGRRVLLWPTEMVNYTSSSPSISYSINPLLYDFRAHNKAKERSAEKKEGLEEGRERKKPSVIKQPDCQQRHQDTKGGSEVKIDEREEKAEGGQGGNPVEVVDHRDGSDKILDCSGCRDESALKLVRVSAECNHAPAPSLQKTAGRRRRRRGGVRRGVRRRGKRKRRGKMERKNSEKDRRISALFANQMFEERGKEKLKREGNIKEEKKDKELLSNLVANRLAGGKETKMRGEERRIRRDQSERERAGRNDEKRGELLSNLPVNRCNRCNQLCVQVKREASQHQSQQSDSEWGQRLRKPLCRGAACNSVISPVSESVTETPCCPAITSDPAGDDKEMEMMHKNMQAGKEDGQRDAEHRNPRRIEIRAAQDAEENMCKPTINSVTFPSRDAASSEEICLVLKAHREAARDPTICLVPVSSRETACSQRQTIPVGQRDAVTAPSPCCPTQQTENKLRIRSACMDVTLDSLSETLQRGRATKKRKGGSLEPVAPRKRRRIGRRQPKKSVNVLTQKWEQSKAGFDSDLCLSEDCNSSKDATSSGDIFIVHRTKNSLCHNSDTEETFICDTTDKPENHCCCDDSEGTDGTANGCSQLNFDPSGGKVTPLHDCHTCNTYIRSTQRDEKSNKDSSTCGASHDNSCNKNDANCEKSCQFHVADLNAEPTWSLTETPSTESSICSTNDLCQSINKHRNSENESTNYKPDDTFDHNSVSSDKTVSRCHIQPKTTPSDSETDCRSCRAVHQRDANCGQCDGFKANLHSNRCSKAANSSSSRNEAEHVLMRERREDERITEKQRQEEEEKKRVKEKQEEWVQRKEREEKEREKRNEMGFEQLFSKKRRCYPHHLPSQCIPLHAPLLLQPSLSSSSSFSFHHTFIQHHLSLLPPPSHLPISSYPHLLPSFSSHLSPLALSPPPAPPPPLPPPPLPHSFYASSPIPLLDGPGPYPLAAAFHHPPLYPSPNPAVLPLQVLF